MKIEQRRWTASQGWHWRRGASASQDAQLVLVFGGTQALSRSDWYVELRAQYPLADVVSCTTAGEISESEVTDEAVVASALTFERTRVKTAVASVAQATDSRGAAHALAAELAGQDLQHVIVLSEGLQINGSELVAGMREALPQHVVVTGGLAGDGARMRETFVGLNAIPSQRRVVAIGLYGSSLHVGYGSLGGWDPFGPERMVTRAENNVLYELDGRSALGLYKQYLGEHAAGLPSSGLLFPLAVRQQQSTTSLVRTILAVDEREQSITFAGDVPKGSIARLMHANFDRLIEGAVGAARGCLRPSDGREPDFALLISCVGRKLLLAQRVEEEVEGVREILGRKPVLAGFYSYGEVCPHVASPKCELHNQTMTITTFTEV